MTILPQKTKLPNILAHTFLKRSALFFQKLILFEEELN